MDYEDYIIECCPSIEDMGGPEDYDYDGSDDVDTDDPEYIEAKRIIDFIALKEYYSCLEELPF